MCNAPYLEHTEPLFKSLNILSLRKLYCYSVLTHAQKRSILETLPQTSARTNLYMYSFMPNLSRLFDFFDVHLVRLLNYLPDEVRTLDSLQELKKYILSSDIESRLSARYV